jgi:hypothetical protein
MLQRHLIRTLIALVLLGLFLSEARARNGRPRQPVMVDVAWSPCPTCDDDGRPLAAAVLYEVFACRDDDPETCVRRTPGDTTCTLKLQPGSTYRLRVVGYDAQGRASQPSEWSDPVVPDPPASSDLLPNEAGLPPNRPNPFNPATTIVYRVPADLAPGAPVSLAVFDVRGRQVRRFTIDRAAGTHEVLWNGTDDRGATVASGVYVTRFVCGDEEVTRRMTMLK